MKRKILLCLGASLLLTAQTAPPAGVLDAQLQGGGHWTAEVPAKWNGTLLLWSRGYSPVADGAEAAPKAYRAALLAAGYALAGSDYGAGGWALAEAIPAQRATIAAFAARYGKPRRVIGWGFSMGGLVTTALAEQRPSALDGAISFCSSMGGAIGMMNMALDGAFVFRTLVAPDANIELTNVDDDRANGARVQRAVEAAMATPEGRARIALAAVLAGLPGWTTHDAPQPAPDDFEAQVREMAKTFAMGVFLPRQDQERRAGGAFSWNNGIDYRSQLALSHRRDLIEALYRRAGISLADDLDRLAKAKRVSARPAAVAYMKSHYTPSAKPTVPLLAVQAIGDGLTSPSLQQGYAAAARSHDVRSLWTRSAGHCAFDPSVVTAAVEQMVVRLETRRWPDPGSTFVDYTPPPMLRPCFRGKSCR
ncbi:alpha/beta fold hydrolase [Sphingomonas sp. RS6]